MLKFARSNTHDLYATRQRHRRNQITGSSEELELEEPPHVSLESLQALIPREDEQVPRQSISLESLEHISLDDLKSLMSGSSPKSKSVELPDDPPAGKSEEAKPPQCKKLKSQNSIPRKSKHLEGTVAVAIAVTALTGFTPLPKESEDIAEIPQFRNRRRSEKPRIQKSQSLTSLRSHTSSIIEGESEEFAAKRREFRNRRRYEKPKTSVPEGSTTSEKSPKASSSSMDEECKSRTKEEQKEKASKTLQKKHEILLEKLKDLSEGENLEKWLKTLDMPQELNIPEIREKITEFFKLKCWENNKENSRWLLDGSLTKRLWHDFKELSTAKQIIVIVILSVLIVIVGFLTVQLLSLLWPSVLGVATSGEGILREIGVEVFKQRQEPAFHLLMDHAEKAKPMTTAWANQYILWKYIRH